MEICYHMLVAYFPFQRGVPLDHAEAELADLNRRMAKAYQELLGLVGIGGCHADTDR